MDNQKENSVFKEEDAKLRDETSDGRKSERENRIRRPAG